MDREIKFRAVCKRTGKLVYGLPISTKAINLDGNVRLSVKEGTIRQFTGLKDINGFEIYEGDIVNFTFFYYQESENVVAKKGEIVFVNFGFALFLQDEEGDAEIYQLSDLTFDSCSDIEIIGTIY